MQTNTVLIFLFEKEQLEEAEQQAEQDAKDGVVLCKRCGAENPKEMFYCCSCGAPLYGDDKNNPNFQQNQNNGQPNPNFNQNQGMPPFGVPLVRQIRKWLPLLILWQE